MHHDESDAELIAAATALVGDYRPSADCCAGGVGAALRARSGRIYSGICIDTACSMGFCAEHAAVAEMLKAREAEVVTIVAVTAAEGIIPPCGRCRELLWQIHPSNRNTRVIMGPGEVMTLAELLPRHWRT
jgi:cytidine deaminase